MKKLNKKGMDFYQPDTAIYYMAFGIVLSIIMTIFMVIIYSQMEESAKTPKGIEDMAAIQRFKSEECFGVDAASDPKISWDAFSQDSMDSCYYIDKDSKKTAFKLELQVLEKPGQIKGKKGVKTANWNDELRVESEKNIPVRVYYNYKKADGNLVIMEQNVGTA